MVKRRMVQSKEKWFSQKENDLFERGSYVMDMAFCAKLAERVSLSDNIFFMTSHDMSVKNDFPKS